MPSPIDRRKPVIVGVTGTHAAGKEETAKFFVALGFKHFNARRDVLLPAVAERGLQPDRNGIHRTATSLRASHGPSYVAYRLFELAQANGGNAVIESIYNEPEIARIRAAANGQFFLIAIDADLEIRYKRSQDRASETDHITFERFCEQQEREMYNADPNKHNLAACQKLADAPVVMNNGTILELHEELRAICILHLGFPALL